MVVVGERYFMDNIGSDVSQEIEKGAVITETRKSNNAFSFQKEIMGNKVSLHIIEMKRFISDMEFRNSTREVEGTLIQGAFIDKNHVRVTNAY